VRVVWLGAVERSARALVARAGGAGDAGARAAVGEARAFLVTMLADGPLAAKTVQMEAAAAGIAERTLWRAKVALGSGRYFIRPVKNRTSSKIRMRTTINSSASPRAMPVCSTAKR